MKAIREDNPNIEVRNSPLHGRGVFATGPIKSGDFIIEYAGKRLTEEEFDALTEQSDENDPNHTMYFTVGNGLTIVPTLDDTGNDARFINHSCDPNCESSIHDDRIFIMAIRDIEPGEELFYDYRLTVDDVEDAMTKYKCYCGSENCRGTMAEVPEPNINDFIYAEIQELRQRFDAMESKIDRMLQLAEEESLARLGTQRVG